MSDSKRELIIQNLVAQLATISTAGGYNFDVSALDIHERLMTYDELGQIRLPCITVTVGTESAKVSLMGSPPKYRGSFPVFVQGWIKCEDKTLIRRTLERMLRDVRVLIFVDMTRGGYSHTQNLVSIKTDEGTLAYDGYGVFEIELEIVYDYLTNAP